jgi:hypothetical protein
MPTYRAYLIDEVDRVASYKPVEADSDSEAMEVARRFVEGFDVEVWHLDRKIGRPAGAKK